MSTTAQANWELTWSDEFTGSAINTNQWHVENRGYWNNNELQYYLPRQVSVSTGQLLIKSENISVAGYPHPYISGRVQTKYTQKFGRFEVRAKLPSTKGIWPAIWLLPASTPWPSGGEIDIMEAGGSQPFRVTQAYHWGANYDQRQYVSNETWGSTPWPDEFHTFAAEWEPNEIRYYVDNNHVYTVNSSMAPISNTPMNLILNTAVGGWFDGNPDNSTQFPQTFAIDYVRMYQKSAPQTHALLNAAFEEDANGWNLSGNAYIQTHNTNTNPQSIAFEGEGGAALKLFGYSNTHVTQNLIDITPNETVTLSARVRTNADDTINNTQNYVGMFINFYDRYDQKVGEKWVKIAENGMVEDQWLEQWITATAPEDAVSMEVGFNFLQPNNEGGAVWIDHIVIPEPTTFLTLAVATTFVLVKRKTSSR
ncbi:glycoside hydrolase family 16 protein [Poriferisphaera corsica]|uniref:glycoside hydrolase family 16 protein n=1 Tax=Poriferisphaera corsica TaxID=2528020 RepID=UPI00190C5D11|nr:glycoside hydrolase family 16 protein [Poriferisphaera corsica]